MKGRGSKYQKRESFSEDEDEQCWKEENGGVDARGGSRGGARGAPAPVEI